MEVRLSRFVLIIVCTLSQVSVLDTWHMNTNNFGLRMALTHSTLFPPKPFPRPGNLFCHQNCRKQKWYGIRAYCSLLSKQGMSVELEQSLWVNRWWHMIYLFPHPHVCASLIGKESVSHIFSSMHHFLIKLTNTSKILLQFCLLWSFSKNLHGWTSPPFAACLRHSNGIIQLQLKWTLCFCTIASHASYITHIHRNSVAIPL